MGLGQRGSDDTFGDFEELEEQGLANRVVDAGADLASLDEVCPAHKTELLGQVGCLDPDFGDELVDRPLPVAQDLEDTDPRG
jgi:hypothetical protein